MFRTNVENYKIDLDKGYSILNNVENNINAFNGFMNLDYGYNCIEKFGDIAKKIYESADIFILIGIGGSNGSARSVISAIDSEDGPEIIYAGNTLSAYELKKVISKIQGKEVYVNVIAKNFKTLEPGLAFRNIRAELEKMYGKDEASRRILVTGTPESDFHELAKKEGYTFLDFPDNVGGRYSAFSAVGVFPLMAMGLNARSYLDGAKKAFNMYKKRELDDAIRYAYLRDYLYRNGISIEVLSLIEPRLKDFSRWWVQLYGETEGKDKKGLYVDSMCYSEDLHAMGQLMQEGIEAIAETFLVFEESDDFILVDKPCYKDGFDYLNNKSLEEVNKAMLEASIEAHQAANKPINRLDVGVVNEETLGFIYMFFILSCIVSATLLEVNPFDQPGVEAYKNSMFKRLLD